MLTAAKTITYEEYRQMEFDDNDRFIYELLNGLLVRKSSPTIQHQRIVRKITIAFEKFLEKQQVGEVFFAPLDVVLSINTATQPDIHFIGKDKKHILNEEEQVVIGVPDIIIEVLSPGSIKRDRIDKKNIYQQYKVTEFWIVDPSSKTIEIYFYKNKTYELLAFEEAKGKVASSVLKGFELDLEKVF